MICPKCGSEYREGFTRCADCDVDLRPPPPAPPPDERASIKLVKVFEGGNPAIIPVLESLLDDAGIEYTTTSENLQDLFGWGRVGGGFNYVIGPIMFYVRAEDEKDARTIVESLAQPPPPELPEEL